MHVTGWLHSVRASLCLVKTGGGALHTEQARTRAHHTEQARGSGDAHLCVHVVHCIDAVACRAVGTLALALALTLTRCDDGHGVRVVECVTDGAGFDRDGGRPCHARIIGPQCRDVLACASFWLDVARNGAYPASRGWEDGAVP